MDRPKLDGSNDAPMTPYWTVTVNLQLGAYLGAWDKSKLLDQEEVEQRHFVYEGRDLEIARKAYEAISGSNVITPGPSASEFCDIEISIVSHNNGTRNICGIAIVRTEEAERIAREARKLVFKLREEYLLGGQTNGEI
jgi:hypothetical protein